MLLAANMFIAAAPSGQAYTYSEALEIETVSDIASLEDIEFCYSTILVTLSNQASTEYSLNRSRVNTNDSEAIKFREFTTKDFPIILSDVHCLTPGLSRMQAQITEKYNIKMSPMARNSEEVENTSYFMDIEEFKRIKVLTLTNPGRQNVLNAIQELQRHSPYVINASPNFLGRAGSVDNREFDFTPHFNPTLQWGLERINTRQAQSITLGNPDIVVGILDTGIQANHPDLNVVQSICFVSNVPRRTGFVGNMNTNPHTNRTYAANEDVDFESHGTKTAGVVSNTNAINGTGVARNIGLASLRIMGWRWSNIANDWDSTGFRLTELIEAIQWATQPNNFIPILNLSGGISLPNQNHVNELQDAIQQYGQAGGLFVTAAGNQTENLNTNNRYPARLSTVLDNVITVGAIEQRNRRICDSLVGFGWGSNFSNQAERWGSVTVNAPGTAIRTTHRNLNINGGYTLVGGGDNRHYSGTSAAAPHIAGVAALMLSVNPSLTPLYIRYFIKETAEEITIDIRNATHTANVRQDVILIDAYRAVRAAEEGFRTININNYDIQGIIQTRTFRTFSPNTRIHFTNIDTSQNMWLLFRATSGQLTIRYRNQAGLFVRTTMVRPGSHILLDDTPHTRYFYVLLAPQFSLTIARASQYIIEQPKFDEIIHYNLSPDTAVIIPFYRSREFNRLMIQCLGSGGQLHRIIVNPIQVQAGNVLSNWINPGGQAHNHMWLEDYTRHYVVAHFTGGRGGALLNLEP